jgi:hypothetical protein
VYKNYPLFGPDLCRRYGPSFIPTSRLLAHFFGLRTRALLVHVRERIGVLSFAGCLLKRQDGTAMAAKPLILLVPQEGIEPPTHALRMR